MTAIETTRAATAKPIRPLTSAVLTLTLSAFITFTVWFAAPGWPRWHCWSDSSIELAHYGRGWQAAGVLFLSLVSRTARDRRTAEHAALPHGDDDVARAACH
jgi:hypothetical protein